MTTGKITIESGDYKAIFDIVRKNDRQLDIKIDFDPELPKENDNKNIIFVKNITNYLINVLKG